MGKVDEIAFIIGDFGEQVEKDLVEIAEGLGAKGSIYYQEEALGTAHAIYCAAPSLTGNLVVAFADTLFRADFTLDSAGGIIWTKQIEDPSAFGVVKLTRMVSLQILWKNRKHLFRPGNYWYLLLQRWRHVKREIPA